jgi:hypothetical protein
LACRPCWPARGAFWTPFDLEQYAAPVTWHEIEAGDTIPLAHPAWTLRTALTEHSRPCIALRWEETGSGQALVYSCDTSPCPAVEELARNADVLIHEATTPGPFPSHTSPRQAGEVARRANVRRLVLVHFSPRWTLPEADALAEVRAGGFAGAAEIGRDGQVLTIGRRRRPRSVARALRPARRYGICNTLFSEPDEFNDNAPENTRYGAPARFDWGTAGVEGEIRAKRVQQSVPCSGIRILFDGQRARTAVPCFRQRRAGGRAEGDQQ